MAPWYQGYNPNFKLGEDDIAGIRFLYGNKNIRLVHTLLRHHWWTTWVNGTYMSMQAPSAPYPE